MKITAEHNRLIEYRKRKLNWKKWGPYLSERSWGTVREDYSEDGQSGVTGLKMLGLKD